MYKRVYPEHTELRERLVNKRRPFFEIPGPDYVWSFDGYDKLKRWGFEIYAGIDAYSRFIVTLYVGTSNSTGRSVIGQYVQLVVVVLLLFLFFARLSRRLASRRA